MLGRRLRAYNASHKPIRLLTLSPTAARLEQQCRAALYLAWPEYAEFCRRYLARTHWSVGEVAAVVEGLKRIEAHPGIQELARRAWPEVAHWNIPVEHFAQVWDSITRFYAEAASLQASVRSREGQVPDSPLLKYETAAGVAPEDLKRGLAPVDAISPQHQTLADQVLQHDVVPAVKDDRLSACAHALVLFSQLGDRLAYASTAKAMADLLVEHGRWADAELYCEEALNLFAAIGDSVGQANTLRSLGAIMMNVGRLEEAARCRAEADALSSKRDVGSVG